jgi:hypothetical protein
MPKTIINAEAGSSHGNGCSEESQPGLRQLARIGSGMAMELTVCDHASMALRPCQPPLVRDPGFELL